MGLLQGATKFLSFPVTVIVDFTVKPGKVIRELLEIAFLALCPQIQSALDAEDIAHTWQDKEEFEPGHVLDDSLAELPLPSPSCRGKEPAVHCELWYIRHNRFHWLIIRDPPVERSKTKHLDSNQRIKNQI